MMEDAITNNSKTAPALEKEGMILFGGEREREREGGDEKKSWLFCVHCTQFIFMRWDAILR